RPGHPLNAARGPLPHAQCVYARITLSLALFPREMEHVGEDAAARWTRERAAPLAALPVRSARRLDAHLAATATRRETVDEEQEHRADDRQEDAADVEVVDAVADVQRYGNEAADDGAGDAE